MKLKRFHFADVAEIQEAVTDELKKAQKEEFSAAFQKLYDCEKSYIYANGAYFELKKGICLPRPPLWSSGQSFWLQIQRSRVRFPALPDFLSSSGSGTGSTQPREVN